MLPFLRWIFGWEDKEEGQFDLTGVNRNTTRNQNHPNYAPFRSTIPPTSYNTHFISQSNALKASNSNFTQNSSAPSAQNKQNESLNISSATKSRIVSIDSGIKPKAIATTLEKPNESDSSLPSSSFGAPPASPKCPPISNKPTLAPINPTTPQEKNKYILVEKGGTSSLYVIPEDIKCLIKRDVVPGVLRMPLSPYTYKDYFAALLYAEDYYLEKWDGFEMKNVSLEIHKAEIHDKKGKFKNLNRSDEKDDKIFIEFEVDSIPEKRPFLLSRDFAFVRPSGSNVEPFQGIIYRVVKSNIVLVEFGEDFHAQHYSARKYDVKFSFNRVCLKRAHQAIAAVSDVFSRNFLFPDCIPKSNLVSKQLLYTNHKLNRQEVSAVRRILIHQSPPPYLVEGPLSINRIKQLTRTGEVIQEAVLQLCRTSSSNRILICAPSNSTCDVLMRSLQKYIPESDMFRANAAFRGLDEVPDDILPFCPYEEFFSCPSLSELQKFRVILSTSMSTFRLHNEGVRAGHFSHIFLVDASSATEPETLVPLANLANEKTVVVITGASGTRSGWVRSNMARQKGLMRSYFDRLRESNLYASLDPEFITQLDGVGQTSDNTYSFSSLN